MKMKGYAMLGIGRTGWIEKEVPVCGPNDALLRPIAVSPCTSDIHTVWEGAIGVRCDMILGHEAVGEVVETGSLVRDFKPGDRVIVPAQLKGAARLFAVGSRPNCVAAARHYGATDIVSYRSGSISAQILEATSGRGVDRVIVAGGDNDTFLEAVQMLRPGGCIGNVNYLGSGEFVRIPRSEWGCGMGHKTITGGLMPGGRLRMEKLAALLQYGRLDTAPLLTHRLSGFESLETALLLMKDKPKELIKPVVLL